MICTNVESPLAVCVNGVNIKSAALTDDAPFISLNESESVAPTQAQSVEPSG